MNRKSVTAFITACLLLFLTRPILAAEPFSVPTSFDLTGSSANFEIRLQTKLFGEVEMALDPNPTPMTGTMTVDVLNPITGIFSGSLQEVTATTNASAAQLKLDVPVTVTLNSNQLSGVFLWKSNKVVCYPESLTATFSLGEQSWEVPFSGIPMSGTYQDGVMSIDVALEHSGTYGSYSFAVDIGLNLVGTLTPGNSGVAWIDLQTDRGAYSAGDDLILYIGLGNSGPARKVDLYLVLIDSAGGVYFAPAFTTAVMPVVSFNLVPDLYIPLTQLLTYSLPTGAPPINSDGSYFFAAAFFDSETGELVGNLASAEFTYTSGATAGIGTEAYDGLWVGTGGSTVVSANCPETASLQFEIENSCISGEASTDTGDGYEVSGEVAADGTIQNGILLEEFGPELYPMGTFSGTFSGDTGSGTWMDDYGCYGSFTVTRFE